MNVRYSDTDVEAVLRQVEALRVFVAGDDPLARGGVTLLLSGQVKVTVVGQSTLSEDWSALAAASGAHAIVVDGAALDSPTRERLRSAALPVLVLVGSQDEAADALGAGAQAALSRDGDAARLVAALRASVRGLIAVDERFSAALVREQRRALPAPVESLTARERQVLELLAQGLPNKVIAQRLSISEHTAKFHVNAILSKLGADSRTEAVVQAARLGLVAL
jgi:two-component system, NarL family, nitrate/nitrite response regulator NarL